MYFLQVIIVKNFYSFILRTQKQHLAFFVFDYH